MYIKFGKTNRRNPFIKLVLVGLVAFSVLHLVSAEVNENDKMLNQTAPEMQYLITYSKDNRPAATLTNLVGKPHLVFFWSPASWNSLTLVADLNLLYDNYRKQGLEIVGCQSPGYQFEIDNGETLSNIKSYGFDFPVIVDDGWKTYRSYKSTTWPMIYLTDQNGVIQRVFKGEIEYQQLDKALKEVLGEPQI